MISIRNVAKLHGHGLLVFSGVILAGFIGYYATLFVIAPSVPDVALSADQTDAQQAESDTTNIPSNLQDNASSVPKTQSRPHPTGSAKTKSVSGFSNIEPQMARFKSLIASGIAAKRLTPQQADKVNAKIASLSDFMNSISSQSMTEQHKAILQKREELRQWAKQNSVPYTYVAILH